MSDFGHDKNILSEDNRTGFHEYHTYTGIDRPNTGGNDAPFPIKPFNFGGSGGGSGIAGNAKKLINGKTNASGDGLNMGISTDNHKITNSFNTTYNIDNSIHHSSVGDGLAFFAQHWKSIAIVGGTMLGTAALIYAISKIVKGLNKSLKIRYNKVVKSLQRAQRDFTLADDGLNMKAVLPGIGSGIFDKIANFITLNGKAKSHKDGNIGLHPFCNQFIDEIESDYKTAVAAFSKIKLGADESGVDKDRNTDPSVGDVGNKSKNGNESYSQETVYNSFREALSTDLLNEGVSEDKINESVLAMISAGVGLANLAVRGGRFLYQRFNKEGKPEGEPKAIQVTKESTREICYAIINNYADKYVNMKQVFTKLGIDSNSLADLSTSDCDKLTEILKKYQQPEANAYTKQYARIKKMYDKMLNHYFKIGTGIIENFVKYSEAKDEKHSNLIVASKEKLENMWESQRDFYENNFSHVIIEIVSSEAYITYLDFILEKVIPVFKSGLASDADYVLDVMPKVNEFYLLRQTGNGQAALESGETNKGNVAIAKVVSVGDKGEMKFKLIGLVDGEGTWTMQQNGTAHLDTTNIDYDTYKEKGDVDIEYSKWLALDPVLLDWSPNMESRMYSRVTKDKVIQYVYAYCERDREGDPNPFNRVVCILAKDTTNEILSVHEYTLENGLSGEEFEKLVSSSTSDEENSLGFSLYEFEKKILNKVRKFTGKTYKPKNVKTTDGLVKVLNELASRMTPSKYPIQGVTKLYSRFNNGAFYEYVYAVCENNFNLNLDGKDETVEFGGKKVNVKLLDSQSGVYKKDVITNCFVFISDGNIDFNKFEADKIRCFSLDITPECTPSDFDKMFTSGNDAFAEVTKGVEFIKGKIFDAVAKYGANIGKHSIDYIDTAIAEIEKKHTDTNVLLDSVSKWADDILSNYNWNSSGQGGRPTIEYDLLGDGKKYFVAPDANDNQKPYILDVSTGVKDKNGKEYMLHVVGVVVEVNKDTYDDNTVMLYVADNKSDYYVCQKTKDDIEKALKSIINGESVKDHGLKLWDANKQMPNNPNQQNKQTQQQTQQTQQNTQGQQNNQQTQQTQQTQPSESITVAYSFDSAVNESEHTSTVNIQRKFSKRMRNWYVLSECVYDDGSNKSSVLDNNLFINKLNERSDCALFAKSSKLAKFMPYDNIQRYGVLSENLYTPSVATPLYESVLLVKFDKIDNIIDKVYLGKNKIG